MSSPGGKRSWKLRVEPERLLEEVVAHVREAARAVPHRVDVAEGARDRLDETHRHGHARPEVEVVRGLRSGLRRSPPRR